MTNVIWKMGFSSLDKSKFIQFIHSSGKTQIRLKASLHMIWMESFIQPVFPGHTLTHAHNSTVSIPWNIYRNNQRWNLHLPSVKWAYLKGFLAVTERKQDSYSSHSWIGINAVNWCNTFNSQDSHPLVSGFGFIKQAPCYSSSIVMTIQKCDRILETFFTWNYKNTICGFLCPFCFNDFSKCNVVPPSGCFCDFNSPVMQFILKCLICCFECVFD